MSQQNTEFNRIAYNLWSESYDQAPNSTVTVDEAHFPPFWRHLKHQDVLEIGCGTGRHTHKLVSQRNRVTAIEISEGMLGLAKKKTAGSVEFIQADFLKTDKLYGRQFDAALTSLVLEHIGDLALFFSRVQAALRPGSDFFMSEIHPDRIAGGSQAHFTDVKTGQTVKLVSFAHAASDIQAAALSSGMSIVEEKDIVGDEPLTRLHPGWEKYLGKPMIRIWRFRKGD